MPKDANPGAHFWIETIENFRNTIFQNIQNQSRENMKIYQNDAKRDPEIIDFGIRLWSGDFRQMLVLQILARSILRIEDPKIHENNKNGKQTYVQKFDAKIWKSHQKGSQTGSKIQTGQENQWPKVDTKSGQKTVGLNPDGGSRLCTMPTQPLGPIYWLDIYADI